MAQVPQVEARGGDHPDWGKVVKGEPLVPLGEEYPEPDSAPLWPEDKWGVQEPPGANDPEAQ